MTRGSSICTRRPSGSGPKHASPSPRLLQRSKCPSAAPRLSQCSLRSFFSPLTILFFSFFCLFSVFSRSLLLLRYNPADEDHQALLSQALTREQQRLAEKERIEKGLPKQLSATKRHQLWLEEAKIVDADGDDDDDGDALAITDGDAEQGDGASSMALVRSVRAENRKTKQQRATELRLKREAEARAASKQQRIIDKWVFFSPTLL
jgi:hypothetical protein